MASYVSTFTGDGSEVHFTAGFPVLRLTDLAVVVDNVWLTLGTDYSVSGSTSSALATLAVAPTVGATVVLRSAVGYTPTDPAAVTTAAPNLNDTDTALWAAIGARTTTSQLAAEATARAAADTAESATRSAADSAEAASRAAADQAIINAGVEVASTTSSMVMPTGGNTSRALGDLFSDVINVKSFGAQGNGAADDTAAIQAAIDYAIYTQTDSTVSGKRIVYLPSGVYKTTDTIHLGYGVSHSPYSQFTSVTLMGDGPKQDRLERTHTGTMIWSQVTDRMAINVQGCRYTRIKGLTVEGVYTHIWDQNLGYAYNDDDWLIATWKDSTWASSRFGQYSSQTGVTVDAYSGTKPATSYPDVTYPAFLGTVSQFGKSYSSDVWLDDVIIRQFVVGLSTPSNSNNNGEFIRHTKGLVQACVYAYSFGETQTRNIDISDVDVSRCYYGITNNTKGNLAGHCHGTYQNIHFGGCYQLVSFYGGYSGPITLRNCYGEVNAVLGSVYGTGNARHLVLDGCTFTFRELDEKYGVPASHASGPDCKIVITNGTQLITRHGFIVATSGANGPSVTLNGGISWAVNAYAIHPAFCLGSGGILASGLTANANNTLVRHIDFHWSGINSGFYNEFDSPFLPYFINQVSYGNRQDNGAGSGQTFNFRAPARYANAGITTTLTGRADNKATLPGARSMAGGGVLLDKGDMILIGDAWFVVTDTASGTELTQITNYRRAAADDSFINKSTSDAASSQINAVIVTRCYRMVSLLGGTVTSGSATMTNVKEVMLDGNQWNDNLVTQYDAAIIDDGLNMAVIGGNTLSRLHYLSSYDKAAQTLTFSAATLGTTRNIYLPVWIKVYT